MKRQIILTGLQDMPDKGIIYDITDSSLHSGPGIRMLVSLKGCPLCCPWCQSPEGINPQPQIVSGKKGERIVGREWTATALAQRINLQKEIMWENGGGVTFSGGEPLMQAKFLLKVLPLLDGIHVVLETSGHGDESDFKRIARQVDIVYFDLKIIDPELHSKWTGADNAIILRNFANLARLGTKVVVRVPLVPGITDTAENLKKIADLARTQPGLVKVELAHYKRSRKKSGASQKANIRYIKSRRHKDVCLDAFNSENVPASIA